MSHQLFITGTDTHCGKTYISVGILNACRALGLSTIGIKPIATGCDPQNEDALALQQAATIKLPYAQINPYAFAPAIAPHIAAAEVGVHIDTKTLTQKIQPALSHPADVHLIEGVGGSHVPLNDHETLSDWLATQPFKVIVVVGIRLGCLNHAILTMRALKADRINVIGWIANCIEPNMPAQTENIQTLTTLFDTPCLEIVAHKRSLFTELSIAHALKLTQHT